MDVFVIILTPCIFASELLALHAYSGQNVHIICSLSQQAKARGGLLGRQSA